MFDKKLIEKTDKLSKKEGMKKHLYKTSLSRNYPELEPWSDSWDWQKPRRKKYRNKGCYNGKKPKWRKYRKEQKNFEKRKRKKLIENLKEIKKYE